MRWSDVRWSLRGRRDRPAAGTAPTGEVAAARADRPAPGVPAPGIPVGGVWARLAADSATAHRRLVELAPPRTGRREPGGPGAPGELSGLLARAGAASGTARDRVRREAAAGATLSSGEGLDLPHDPAARTLYDDLAALVGAQRNAVHRVSLLTVPAPVGEHRFLLSGLRRAVADLEVRATPSDASEGLRVQNRHGWVP